MPGFSVAVRNAELGDANGIDAGWFFYAEDCAERCSVFDQTNPGCVGLVFLKIGDRIFLIFRRMYNDISAIIYFKFCVYTPRRAWQMRHFQILFPGMFFYKN